MHARIQTNCQPVESSMEARAGQMQVFLGHRCGGLRVVEKMGRRLPIRRILINFRHIRGLKWDMYPGACVDVDSSTSYLYTMDCVCFLGDSGLFLVAPVN